MIGCQRVSIRASVARRPASADESFDAIIEEKWKLHLASMSSSVASSKGKKGRYYKIWRETVTLEDEPQRDKTTVESVVGSPPFTEDDRRPRPALNEEHSLGGRGESKLEESRSDDSDVERDLSSEEEAEILADCEFHEISYAEEDASREVRAKERVRDAHAEEEWKIRQATTFPKKEVSLSRLEAVDGSCRGGCCSVGTPDLDVELEDRNTQVARLIAALGSTGDSGKRAVLEAIARKQGIDDSAEVDKIFEGKSDVKLQVPRHLRVPLESIGLGEMLAPTQIITTLDHEGILLAGESSDWHDVEFEVALDSGSVVHVCSIEDVPGYKVGESPGSRRGQEFLMGDGGTIPNLGQSSLNLHDTGIDRDIQSVFQIAAVTRPLMSVGRICDEGHNITFDAVMAVVKSKDGGEICRFHRNGSGLYVAKLKLRSPAGFGGQE